MVLYKFISNFAMFTLAFLLCACSDGGKTAGTSEESEGIVAIKDREIAGVSQKGPFLVGSSVAIQELDGHMLMQTGNSFRASIKNDQGDFVVKSVNLVSQYALLEVNGYYRNEVSGEKSKGMIALNALTDLKDRSHVNVNLMTHLTVDRILALVQKEGKSFVEAKKQAEREVLLSFGVLDDMESGEDLNLFKGDGGALLLAMGILMQGEGSEADLSERIAHAAIAFGGSGVWQDSEKTEIADWAFRVEEGLKKTVKFESILQHIRENVEAWNIVDSVPHFEEFVYKFWAHEYGLGLCNESNVYEEKMNTNSSSLYYDYSFVCNPNGHWSLARMREIQDGFEGVARSGRDEEPYKIISIAGKKWMAENARIKVEDLHFLESVCYEEKETNCEVFGMLYPYTRAKSVCPAGYRLPKTSEVKELLQFYEKNGKDAAQSLRAMNGLGILYGGYAKEATGIYLFRGMGELATIWIYGGHKLLIIDSHGARITSVTKLNAQIYSEVPEYVEAANQEEGDDDDEDEVSEGSDVFPIKASVRCIED